MTDSELMNLAGRAEVIGRKYPIFLERILLLLVVITFLYGRQFVDDETGTGLISILSTWCLFPFILLFSAEMLGRLIQAMNRS